MDPKKELETFAQLALEEEKNRIAQYIRDAGDAVLKEVKEGRVISLVGKGTTAPPAPTPGNGDGGNGGKPTDEDLVTRAAAARAVGVSYPVLMRMTNKGEIPTHGKGRRQRVKLAEVREALRKAS